MTNDQIIDTAHRGVFRTPAPQSALVGFGVMLSNGYITQEGLIANFISNTDNVNWVRPVIRLYQAIFNRKPDSGGLDYWVSQYRAYGTPSQANLQAMASSWFGTQEYTSAYPASMSNREFVEKVYLNVFGRASDAGGAAYWAQQLDTGAYSRQGLIVYFSESAENLQRTDAAVTAFQRLCGYGDANAYNGPLL